LRGGDVTDEGPVLPKSYRQWVFAKPISGSPLGREHFQLRHLPMPEPSTGQALVRILLVNIHSAARQRMLGGATKLGNTDPTNYACAEVIQSCDPAFEEGDVIHCQAGWQEYQLISSGDPAINYPPASELVKAVHGTNSQWTYVFRPVLVKLWSPSILMEMFGTSGMTAYFGMRECGPLMPRDHVAVAGSSGSVGSIAAQLAKIAGARVIGFAGGAERCRWVVDTLGIDGCLDYLADDIDARLQRAFPVGIDVFSDGVGGGLTDAVLRLMNQDGRMLSYGAGAALYSDAPSLPTPGSSLRRMVGITEAMERTLRERNIKSEAWIVDAFYHERLRAEDDLSRLMLTGRLKPVTHVIDGFDHLPDAIADLYRSGRSGKLQVQFATRG
jgi:NADPH-dependent curcumin reductase CurA